MTPSSDTNSVTTIRAAISRSPLPQLVAYRLLLTPEHLRSQTHAARDRSNASSHAEWWRTARHDRLPNHAIREMRHAVGLGEPGLLQLDPLRKPIEQASSPTEQDVDQVDPDLVHEARREELPVQVGAHEPDALVASHLLGLRQSALDPVGDEGEHQVGARGRPVGDHEARDIAERALATPG